MIYAYRHPQPLQIVQRYDFADCASADFIAAWKETRSDAKARLKLAAAPDKPAPAYPQGGMPVTGLMRTEDGLWTLIRKYEVFGRLFSSYLPDAKKHPDAEIASVADHISFGEALLRHAQDGNCLQFLSTLLKLLDALGELDPSALTARDAQRIIALMDGESGLIADMGSSQ